MPARTRATSPETARAAHQRRVCPVRDAEMDAPLPPAVTKTEHAYLAIRRAIVTGEIAPGESLDEAELMTRFEVGRTPCREALKRLALERFVLWPPRRSPYVRAIDAVEQARLHEARLLLEVRTSELAATRAQPTELERLDDLVAVMGEQLRERRFYEAVLTDHAIHHGIARASGNPFLAEAIANLNLGTLRQWHQALSTQDTSTVERDHGAVVHAIRRGDVAGSARQMTRHIRQNYDRQLRLLALPVAETAGSLEDDAELA